MKNIKDKDDNIIAWMIHNEFGEIVGYRIIIKGVMSKVDRATYMLFIKEHTT